MLRVHAAGLAARWFWERLGYTTIEVSYLGKEPRRARTERTGESTPDALSWSRAGYEISTDRARLDLHVVHGFLRASYWATAIPRRVMERSIENSLCFGLYDQAGRQCGFARVVTDRATAAVLCDVFVLSGHRRRGLGVWLVECALTHPELEGIRRWSLVTADAHGLYRRFGFRAPERPMDYMIIERRPSELWGSGGE